MSRPPFGSPEWLPYFLEVVKTSKTRWEAVKRLGYANPSIIDYHLKKFGIERPPQWKLKPGVSRQRRGRVPDVVIKDSGDRKWVAGLALGEGCIKTHYSKKSDVTALELGIGMTTSRVIFRFCDLVGTRHPRRAQPRQEGKPMWYATISGLRAYRVLQEILPFLIDEKLDEANRALEFFAPDGYRKGRYGGYDVWPDAEFPLRKRGLTRYMRSISAKAAASNKSSVPEDSQPVLRMDRSCLKIGDVLLDARPDGLGLTEIMDDSGLSWTAVIHHLKHLEDNLFVTKEKVHQKLGGPKLLYKTLSKLVELRDRGWIPDSPERPSKAVDEDARSLEEGNASTDPK